MADKRMFSKKITNSDSFLEMPVSSRELYFHLNMNADDDGFLNNPKTITRFVGAKEDDLKMLIMKGFIIPFETGIVVIKHWRVNNLIRSDRYHETSCKEEFSRLELLNNEYVLKDLDTIGIPNGYQMDTEVRLGKDRIGNNIVSKDTPPKDNSEIDQMFNEFWDLYPKKVGKKGCYTSFKRIKNLKTVFPKIIEVVKKRKESYEWTKENGRYALNPQTFINGERWNDQIDQVVVSTNEANPFDEL